MEHDSPIISKLDSVAELLILEIPLSSSLQVRFPDSIPQILFGNSTILPCRYVNEGRAKLALRTATYCMPPEQNDAKKKSSPHFTDGQVFLSPNDDDYPKQPRKEAAASLIQSGFDLETNILNLGNRETFLDKLKAVHLHILAMEQWNVSRLKMCHRYA